MLVNGSHCGLIRTVVTSDPVSFPPLAEFQAQASAPGISLHFTCVSAEQWTAVLSALLLTDGGTHSSGHQAESGE